MGQARAKGIAALLLAIGLLAPAVALPAVGGLDPSFGAGGSGTAGLSKDIARALLVQPLDGKLIAVGEASDAAGGDFALARYSNLGSLDSTFGTGGKVRTNFGSTNDRAYAAALQSDGRIVAVGHARGANLDFALARYNTDGSLDAAFGTGGKVTTNFPANGEEGAYAVAIQSDGKIVAAGYAYTGSGYHFALARYLANGTLDATFGTGGLVTTAFPGSSFDTINAIAIQPDGKIVVAGGSLSGVIDFELARYNANGTLDTSFGTAGLVSFDFGHNGFDAVFDLALQPDGKILAAGRGFNGTQACFALARLNADGTMDASFGSGGKTLTALANAGDAVAYAVRLTGTSILVAGYAKVGKTSDIAIVRYGANGSVDSSFGTGGHATFATNSDVDMLGLVPWQGFFIVAGNGRSVAPAGRSATGNLDFSLVRFSATTGAVDATFNAGKVVLTDLTNTGTGEWTSIAAQSNGMLVTAGYLSNGAVNDFALSRYYANGSLDTTFGTGGLVLTNFPFGGDDRAQGVAIQPDGKIVAAGQAYVAANNSDFALARYTTTGALDATFGTGGIVTASGLTATSDDYADAVALQADGKIVIAGQSILKSLGATYECVVARFNADGSRDTTFGTNGLRVLAFGAGTNCGLNAITIQSDGRIVVAGRDGGTQVMARMLAANGAPDTSFNVDGVYIRATGSGGIQGFAIQPADGKFVAAGSAGTAFDLDFDVIRVDTAGNLDATFGTSGQTLTPFAGGKNDEAFALVLQSDNKIVLAGSGDAGTGTDLALQRLNANGSPDTSFGSGGISTIPVGNGTSIDRARAVSISGTTAVVAGASQGVPMIAGVLLGKMNSVTSLLATPAAAIAGVPVVLTGSISSAAEVATGSVNIFDGAVQIGTTPVDFLGNYRFTTSALALGSHSLTASYSGDSGYNASTSAVATVTIGAGVTPTLQVTSLVNPNTAGQAATFTVTVSGSAGIPTGSACFQIDGGSKSCGGLDAAGKRTFSPSLAAGSHTITASYSGDTTYNQGAVATLTQVVKPASSTALGINPGTLACGASSVFTATLTGGPPTPTGLVTFRDGASASVGTGTLDGAGVATANVAATRAGSFTYTANYPGDATYGASASSAVPVTVTVISPSLLLSASANPVAAGVPVTFSATVVAPGSCEAATGLVTFKDSGVTLGTATMAGGIATFTTSSLSPLSAHAITAEYAGATSYNAATSGTLSLIVTPTTTYSLGLTIAGTGSVTSAPAGINCAASCKADFLVGTAVTLSALAGKGQTFTGWSGACSGTATCNVTMSAARNVTAAFTPTASTVALSVSQSGAPSPAFTGKDVMYTINASNAGPATATNVVLSDLLPVGASFVWASPGCTANAGTVTCAIGSLAPGASVQRKVVARPVLASIATNTVTITATQADGDASNNASNSQISVSASPAGVAVQRYRLFSPVTNEHLYTTDPNEYNVLGSFVGTWIQEGPVGKVLNNPGAFGGVAATPYYRLYNTSTAQHHWTTDPNEYYLLILFPQYSGEGVDGYILPTQAPGSVPLYRLLYPYDIPVAGLHHWTIDAAEYNALIATFGWIGEGGSGFVIP